MMFRTGKQNGHWPTLGSRPTPHPDEEIPAVLCAMPPGRPCFYSTTQFPRPLLPRLATVSTAGTACGGERLCGAHQCSSLCMTATCCRAAAAPACASPFRRRRPPRRRGVRCCAPQVQYTSRCSRYDRPRPAPPPSPPLLPPLRGDCCTLTGEPFSGRPLPPPPHHLTPPHALTRHDGAFYFCAALASASTATAWGVRLGGLAGVGGG